MIINQTGGGKKPTGTKSITSNGVYDVTDFASADVNVPTTAPALYREFQLDSNGNLTSSKTITHIMDFTGVKNILNSTLAYMYYQNTAISGAVDISDLTVLNIAYVCEYMFNGCTGLTSVDLSGLTTVSGSNACNNMFFGCTGLTSVDLSSLTTISEPGACQSMFQSCTGLTSVNLSSLTTISGVTAFYSMFNGCTGLTSVDLSSLTTISGSSALEGAFGGCVSLTTVRIGNTTAINFGTRPNQFTNMFSYCPQSIDVYAPAANQARIEAFSGYPNFGGTGTVTWHWNS